MARRELTHADCAQSYRGIPAGLGFLLHQRRRASKRRLNPQAISKRNVDGMRGTLPSLFVGMI